jgi:hypothetical protein
MQMKKILFCLLSLIASLSVHSAEKGSTALLVCTGDSIEYIDSKSPTVQATSINLSITPKSGLAQVDKSWGCKGSDALCKNFTLSQQKDKFSYENSESDSNYSSKVSFVFLGASAKLTTEFVRNYKPPSKDSKKKRLVDWSTQKITSDLKCKGVKQF